MLKSGYCEAVSLIDTSFVFSRNRNENIDEFSGNSLHEKSDNVIIIEPR